MSNHPHEDQFLEEVFGLFALEAQEWIAQCKTALLELEHRPSEDWQEKLYETIICGVTNLGGSAATVELPALENLAFALLPLLQVMRERGSRSPVEQLAALREGLDEMTLAVEHLEETKNGTVRGFDSVLKRLADSINLPCAPEPSHQAPPSSSSSQSVVEIPVTSLSPSSLLGALHDLERSRSESMDQTRHVVEAVIKRAKTEHGEERNGSHFDASTILRILEELEARDERFLKELGQRLPTIEGVLSELKAGSSEAWGPNSRTDSVLQEIHLLHEAARELEAKPIMLFFHGLQMFLGVMSRHGVSVLPQRIEAVISRLRTILPMAQEWVEIGRDERASVQKIVHP